MNVKTAVLFFLCVLPCFGSGKLFLLLDERLKKSKTEQMLYKFVPLTDAQEVELLYVQDFMKGGAAAAYAEKLQGAERGIYIGADSWPEDKHVTELTQSKAWAATAGRISFVIESNAPDYARLPKGIYPRRELWKKYSELTNHKYAGFFPLHYLDTTQNELKEAKWSGYTCIHESAQVLKPGKNSPLMITGNQVQMVFRNRRHLDFIGALVCTNTPKGDTIFEIHTAKTDVELMADSGRFSLWNEAQPLKVRVVSSRQISAPLALQIVPEVNESQTEFFFQGERITCTSARCRKKEARFLLPQFRDFNENFELAIRATGESYFRGTLLLMAGEIEVARTSFRFTPMSRVAETSYALKNPSEYQSAFFIILAAVLAFIGLFFILRMAWQNAAARRAEQGIPEIPKQTSATVLIERGVSYRMTAGENPFSCELYAFGGIVVLQVEGDLVSVRFGGREQKLPLLDFRLALPDGYILEIKITSDGRLLLEAYLLSLVGAI